MLYSPLLVVCRSVGVSNFGVGHLEGLRAAGRPLPSVNQVELHAMWRQRHIVDWCRQHGVTVMGYSPLVKARYLNDNRLTALASRSVSSGFVKRGCVIALFSQCSAVVYLAIGSPGSAGRPRGPK